MVKKENKKKDKNGIFNRIEFNKQFWMSSILLIIMVLSIAGFAMISAGPTAKDSNGKLLNDVPLQYFDQYGVWGAVINGQEFIFKDINQYNSMIDLVGLADKIKSKKNLNLYVDKNFDPSSDFLIEKAISALKIDYSKINNFDCTPNNLILTNNQSIKGNCMVFYSPINDTYNRANGLVYNLIK